jgi:hypothetical protein
MGRSGIAHAAAHASPQREFHHERKCHPEPSKDGNTANNGSHSERCIAESLAVGGIAFPHRRPTTEGLSTGVEK